MFQSSSFLGTHTNLPCSTAIVALGDSSPGSSCYPDSNLRPLSDQYLRGVAQRPGGAGPGCCSQESSCLAAPWDSQCWGQTPSFLKKTERDKAAVPLVPEGSGVPRMDKVFSRETWPQTLLRSLEQPGRVGLLSWGQVQAGCAEGDSGWNLRSQGPGDQLSWGKSCPEGTSLHGESSSQALMCRALQVETGKVGLQDSQTQAP